MYWFAFCSVTWSPAFLKRCAQAEVIFQCPTTSGSEAAPSKLLLEPTNDVRNPEWLCMCVLSTSRACSRPTEIIINWHIRKRSLSKSEDVHDG